MQTLFNYEKESNGDSLIHLGAKNHHKNGCLAVIIEELSQCPKDFAKLINKLNFYGNTALMDAVLQGQYPTVQLLIAHGADVNIRNRIGNTVAHIAALNGHLRILQLLVEKKINVLAKNFEDYTCFDHAEQMAHSEIAEFLEPIVIKAEIWKAKNCAVKIFLNKKRITRFRKVPMGVFREIIKYA